MAEMNISQAEADALIALEKQCAENSRYSFPDPGDNLAIALISADKRENFILDITRSQIKLTKATYQNRARQVIILIRLDLDGPPHTNPGPEYQQIPCPHLHVYQEGYGDKWAIPAPVDKYPNVQDLFSTFEAFMQHCNITEPPQIDRGLF